LLFQDYRITSRRTNSSSKMDIWFSFTETNRELLNKEPKFRSDDVIIPFVIGENGLHYIEEVIPEETVVAMVAQRMQKLTNAELVHIQLCHICPTLMRHLFRVSSDIPKLRGLNDFTCHCCVEEN